MIHKEVRKALYYLVMITYHTKPAFSIRKIIMMMMMIKLLYHDYINRFIVISPLS